MINEIIPEFIVLSACFAKRKGLAYGNYCDFRLKFCYSAARKLTEIGHHMNSRHVVSARLHLIGEHFPQTIWFRPSAFRFLK